MSLELINRNVSEHMEALKNGEYSSRELTEAYITQIEMMDDKIGAYLTLDFETALKKAEDVDYKRLHGKNLKPLAGIPCAVKDNICTKGISTHLSVSVIINLLLMFHILFEANKYIILAICSLVL